MKELNRECKSSTWKQCLGREGQEHRAALHGAGGSGRGESRRTGEAPPVKPEHSVRLRPGQKVRGRCAEVRAMELCFEHVQLES